jgi:hypothetical protein
VSHTFTGVPWRHIFQKYRRARAEARSCPAEFPEGKHLASAREMRIWEIRSAISRVHVFPGTTNCLLRVNRTSTQTPHSQKFEEGTPLSWVDFILLWSSNSCDRANSYVYFLHLGTNAAAHLGQTKRRIMLWFGTCLTQLYEGIYISTTPVLVISRDWRRNTLLVVNSQLSPIHHASLVFVEGCHVGKLWIGQVLTL